MTLVARVIGYKRNQVVVPAGQAITNIQLERDVLQLEGLVVTGQATTAERRNASTAVSTVSNTELVGGTPPASLENALQGKVVGATINMNSGAPGGGGQIQIRGPTTVLGNGQPLYVVDGIIIDNTATSSGINSVTGASGRSTNNRTNQDNPVNRLADINSNDIESIQILKSAAATAIYGAKATNGVVLITTKRGRSGAPQFNVTQRVGQNQAIRLLGSRHFTAATLAASYGAVGKAIADSVCTSGTCPFYDYQGQLYGVTDLSYETLASVSGGTDATRYFLSGSNKYDAGTQIRSGATRQSLRVNLDQDFGSRFALNVSTNVSRSMTDRGLSNNDNTGTSPIYALGYAPAVVDLQTRDAAGNFPLNPWGKGSSSATSNPFQTLTYLLNREDVLRGIGQGTVKYNALSTNHHTLQFSALAGFDTYSQDNQVYSPNFLQYEPADKRLGTAVQGNATSRLFNGSVSAVHTLTPSADGRLRLLNAATTSVGLQYETSAINEYSVRAEGLIPTVDNINQGSPTLFQERKAEKGQAIFVNEELLAFGERLSVAGGVRAERSSVNGDREKYYMWPRGSASYRFERPFAGTDEVKLRAAFGTSGNRPAYGFRDVVLNGLGLIDSRNGLGVNLTRGNPAIMPEKMTEQEYGIDAQFFKQRIAIEASYFDRTITDLLLTAPLAPTSGFTQQYINGGRLANRGVELAVTAVPIRTRNITWTSRAQYFTYKSKVEELPVADFTIASSGFGAEYGRGRIAKGYETTLIWGNIPQANGSSLELPIANARPDFTMQFGNDFTYKGLALNVLLDWQKGGATSHLTQSTFDEGANSRDYDAPAACLKVLTGAPICPAAGDARTLGKFRYDSWRGGQDARVYIQDASYVKLREVTLSYQVPESFRRRLPIGSRDLRLSASGRNLHFWTDYWGSDPEASNFGNQNIARFVDHAAYPPSRSFFFSVDVGF